MRVCDLGQFMSYKLTSRKSGSVNKLKFAFYYFANLPCVYQPFPHHTRCVCVEIFFPDCGGTMYFYWGRCSPGRAAAGGLGAVCRHCPPDSQCRSDQDIKISALMLPAFWGLWGHLWVLINFFCLSAFI